MIDSEGNTVSAEFEVSFTIPGFAEVYVDEEGLCLLVLVENYPDLFTTHKASWHEVKDWLDARGDKDS